MKTLDSGADSGADAPTLAGIHHLKRPVTDLARSLLAKAIHVADRSPYHLLTLEGIDDGLRTVGFGHREIEPSLGGHLMRFSAQLAVRPVQSPSQ